MRNVAFILTVLGFTLLRWGFPHTGWVTDVAMLKLINDGLAISTGVVIGIYVKGAFDSGSGIGEA